MSRGKLIFNISQLPTGSYEISGSFFGTASWAESASYALRATSASFALTASRSLLSIDTASVNNATITFTKGNATTFPITINNVVNSTSASFATNSTTATSASFALTASYAMNGGGGTGNGFPFSGSAVITGSLEIKSNVNNIFLIRNFNNQSILTVSQSGVVIVATQSVNLTGSAPNGGIYFTSGSFFIGLD